MVTGSGSRQLRQFDLQAAGRKKVRLPFFLDRYITALALKQMAGRPTDVLLRKCGQEWEIVADGEVIDLTDRKRIFRLGPVEIHS